MSQQRILLNSVAQQNCVKIIKYTVGYKPQKGYVLIVSTMEIKKHVTCSCTGTQGGKWKNI